MEESKGAEVHLKSDDSSLEAGPNQLGEKINTEALDLDHLGETQGYVLDEAILRHSLLSCGRAIALRHI
jgi:hypothetical protein